MCLLCQTITTTVTSFCKSGKIIIKFWLNTLAGVGDISWGVAAAAAAGVHYLHRSSLLLLPCKPKGAAESNNHETALQWCNLLSAGGFCRRTKTNRGADDTKTPPLIFSPHLSAFSFSSQQPWHTSRCLSLLPPSLAVMLSWLHSKGYAVYPPSLPVSPLPPTVSHTHTHTLAPPQSLALSTIYRPHNHDTYSCAKAFTVNGWDEVFSLRFDWMWKKWKCTSFLHRLYWSRPLKSKCWSSPHSWIDKVLGGLPLPRFVSASHSRRESPLCLRPMGSVKSGFK